jgi:hypothetical protein
MLKCASLASLPLKCFQCPQGYPDCIKSLPQAAARSTADTTGSGTTVAAGTDSGIWLTHSVLLPIFPDTGAGQQQHRQIVVLHNGT